jgi:hypothetical protein
MSKFNYQFSFIEHNGERVTEWGDDKGYDSLVDCVAELVSLAWEAYNPDNPKSILSQTMTVYNTNCDYPVGFFYYDKGLFGTIMLKGIGPSKLCCGEWEYPYQEADDAA